MNSAELYVYGDLSRYDMPAIEEAVELINEYKATEWYESKQRILDQWHPDEKCVRDIINSVMTCCLQEEYLTLQGLIGKLNHKIKLPDEASRLTIIADIIGLVSLTDRHSL